MKQFAGIDLEKIDVKSAAMLNVVGTVFLNNYQNHYFIPANYPDDQSVINPLRNFIRWHLIPIRNLDQTMVMIIKHLPDDEDNCGNTDDKLIIATLKLNLRAQGYGGLDGYSFRKLDFIKRCEMVENFRSKGDFNNWDKYVSNVYGALYRKLFAMANQSLLGIASISDTRNKSIKKNDLPSIIALQISYYAMILIYLGDKLYHGSIIEIYNKVEKQLIDSINQLKKLPDPNAIATADCLFTDMFFSYRHTYKNTRVSPELRQPWLDTRARRFNYL